MKRRDNIIFLPYYRKRPRLYKEYIKISSAAKLVLVGFFVCWLVKHRDKFSFHCIEWCCDLSQEGSDGSLFSELWYLELDTV
jgi:hypothetical protein